MFTLDGPTTGLLVQRNPAAEIMINITGRYTIGTKIMDIGTSVAVSAIDFKIVMLGFVLDPFGIPSSFPVPLVLKQYLKIFINPSETDRC
jgi:hypothetical protein